MKIVLAFFIKITLLCWDRGVNFSLYKYKQTTPFDACLVVSHVSIQVTLIIIRAPAANLVQGEQYFSLY